MGLEQCLAQSKSHWSLFLLFKHWWSHIPQERRTQKVRTQIGRIFPRLPQRVKNREGGARRPRGAVGTTRAWRVLALLPPTQGLGT